ncbi:hypothetical protein A2V49_01470 [candidate division WWE3 bacterium RBG_19FT_COMBO_34_6]|uniref:2'-5' RNA ligase n=1 Tax=candidate division WWE3 bacterium RBG_19FT_COMBO_34_6 TaxID=1802612 RepID=A0A1F4UJV9_UNCKA|nr:MAG: hypothetical protein A2V49_01470 [candidate division WWE3 bacterium RBG_19FT_COMBO_34_6]
MKKNSRIVIVYFLHEQKIGLNFTKWPNHITLIPYFNTTDINKLIDDIRCKISDYKNIPYEVDGVDYFGTNNKDKVNRVKISNSLIKLHSDILNIALSHDGKMNAVFCGDEYKPHITRNELPYPQKDDIGIIDKIYLVENLYKKINGKRIVEIINLL